MPSKQPHPQLITHHRLQHGADVPMPFAAQYNLAVGAVAAPFPGLDEYHIHGAHYGATGPENPKLKMASNYGIMADLFVLGGLGSAKCP